MAARNLPVRPARPSTGWDIRLIALDLDGTLFTDDKHITARTLDTLAAALARGVAVAPATGRPASGVPQELLALPGLRYALTSNGARVWDLIENAPVAEFLMPKDEVAAVLRLLERYEIVADLFVDGQRVCVPLPEGRLERVAPPNMLPYLRGNRTEVPDIYAYLDASAQLPEKLSLLFADPAERADAWRRIEAMGLEVSSSIPNNLEVNARGVTKASGLLALAAHLGLTRGQLMACGDSGNDLAMLRAAGLGVAMGNAEPAVKAAAAYVTATNQEDGVAQAIERFVLG